MAESLTDPMAQMSDLDLAYLIKQHEDELKDLNAVSDEDLDALLKDYEATGGNVDTSKPPVFVEPEPDLSVGETIAGGARELLGGAAFEFGDEGEAAVRAAATGQPYQKLLDEIRQSRAVFEKAYPGTALGLNVAGGIGTMFIPGVGAVGKGLEAVTGIGKITNPIAKVATKGAGAGALAGFGSGEDMEGRFANAGTGALLGAGMGVGLTKAVDAARFGRDAYRAARNLVPEGEAVNNATDILIKNMERAGKTPEEIAEALRLDREYGVNTVLGQADQGLGGLMDVAAATPSEGTGRATLIERLFRQQAGAKARTQKQVTENIPTPDYFATEDAVANSLRTNAQRAYDAIPDVDITDGRIMDFLKNPDIKGAFDDAVKNSERNAAAAALEGTDPSAFKLRDIYVTDPAGNVTISKAPDIKTLDFIKQALDRRISSLYASGQGGEATALKNMRNAFMKRLDDIGPDEYKAARMQYKGDIEIKEALEMGRNASKTEWQRFRKTFNDYSPGEQQAAKTGLVQDVMAMIERGSTDRNVAKQVINDDGLRKKLQTVMDPDEFKLFEAALRREADLFKQTSRIANNSATFGRTAAKADVDQMIEQNTDSALDLFMNPTPGGILRAVLKTGQRLKSANVPSRTWGQLSKMLSASSDDELADVFRAIDDRLPAVQAQSAAREGKLTKAAIAAGAAAAPTPEIDRERLPEDVEFKLPSLEEPAPLGGMGEGIGFEGPPAQAEDPDAAMRQFWTDFAKLPPEQQEAFKQYMMQKQGMAR